MFTNQRSSKWHSSIPWTPHQLHYSKCYTQGDWSPWVTPLPPSPEAFSQKNINNFPSVCTRSLCLSWTLAEVCQIGHSNHVTPHWLHHAYFSHLVIFSWCPTDIWKHMSFLSKDIIWSTLHINLLSLPNLSLGSNKTITIIKSHPELSKSFLRDSSEIFNIFPFYFTYSSYILTTVFPSSLLPVPPHT